MTGTRGDAGSSWGDTKPRWRMPTARCPPPAAGLAASTWRAAPRARPGALHGQRNRQLLLPRAGTAKKAAVWVEVYSTRPEPRQGEGARHRGAPLTTEDQGGAGTGRSRRRAHGRWGRDLREAAESQQRRRTNRER